MKKLGNVRKVGLKDLEKKEFKDACLVLIDTNFLLSVGELHVDIFSEIDRCILDKYSFVLLDAVLRELDNLIEVSRGKKKMAARLAKQILDTKDYIVLEGFNESPTADESILDFISAYRRMLGDKRTIFLATQDKELRNKVAKNIINCGFLIIRQQKYVVLE